MPAGSARAAPAGALSPAERNRLVGILGLLASPFDGERAAAGLLATRMLRACGLSWDGLIGGQDAPPHQPTRPGDTAADLTLCRRHVATLNPWQARFVAGIVQQRQGLSPAQRSKLAETARELRARGLA